MTELKKILKEIIEMDEDKLKFLDPEKEVNFMVHGASGKEEYCGNDYRSYLVGRISAIRDIMDHMED